MFLNVAVASICTYGNYYVGQYGLQKNIHKVFEFITHEKNLDRESPVALRAQKFMQEEILKEREEKINRKKKNKE